MTRQITITNTSNGWNEDYEIQFVNDEGGLDQILLSPTQSITKSIDDGDYIRFINKGDEEKIVGKRTDEEG